MSDIRLSLKRKDGSSIECSAVDLGDYDNYCSHVLVAIGEDAKRLAAELFPEVDMETVKKVAVFLDRADVGLLQTQSYREAVEYRQAIVFSGNREPMHKPILFDPLVLGAI